MKRFFAPSIALVREYWPAYVIINAAFYGLAVAGIVYAFLRPEEQARMIEMFLQGFEAGPLSVAREAYLSGNVPAAAAITFAYNFFVGSILAMTVPSLVIPFAGSIVGLLRALLVFGLALAPTSLEQALARLPHFPVFIVEGQAYVLVMLGVHILWSSAFAGLRAGPSGFAQGYAAGIRANVRIYLLVFTILALAAIYEAIELIYLVSRG